MWRISHRADPFAKALADRHYNRQRPESPQFAPPGRCLVLTADTPFGEAFWITSWPFAEYTRHAWPGAWVCSAFRNEGAGLSSTLITQAVAATVAYFGPSPPRGMVTFVDTRKVRAGNPGYCYQQAGFKRVGCTKGGLVALQLAPEAMPPAEMPRGFAFPHKHALLNGEGWAQIWT